MAPARPFSLPFWFPFAVIALIIAWPTADRVRVAHAADPDVQLVVADLRADELLLVDSGNEAVVQRVALPGGGHELLELPDGRVVVSIEQGGVLAVVDLRTAEVSELAIGGTPHGLALDGAVLLVTDRDVDQIRRFEVGDWSELEPIATGAWPHAVAQTADGTIVVASALDDQISIGARQIEVSELPETVAVASDGTIATVGAVGGVLHLLDGDGIELLRVALGGRPVRVVFSPDGQQIAVALSASGEIAVVDRSGGVRRAAVPGVPDGLAFDPSGDRIYVSDVVGGGIAVLDTVDLELQSVIEAGTATGAILVR